MNVQLGTDVFKTGRPRFYDGQYDAHPLLTVELWRLKFKLAWCTKWWLGYQSYGDYCGGYQIDICIVPPLMFGVRWRWLR